jgi:hypothetical protein
MGTYRESLKPGHENRDSEVIRSTEALQLETHKVVTSYIVETVLPEHISVDMHDASRFGDVEGRNQWPSAD